MIFAKFLTNVRQTQVGQLADQVDGYLPGFGSSLIFQRATKNRFIDGIELTDLADDQTGRGQRGIFIFKHIINGAGDMRQIQGHIV